MGAETRRLESVRGGQGFEGQCPSLVIGSSADRPAGIA